MALNMLKRGVLVFLLHLPVRHGVCGTEMTLLEETINSSDTAVQLFPTRKLH